MISKKALKPAAAVFATGAMCATMAIAPFSPAVPQAHANTYSNLVNAQNRKSDSAQREAQLRSQLSGVKSDLANKIVELDKLTNTKIPAAQAEVDEANAAAASAQSEAEAAASRLEAAKKDKENLEEQIEQTGKDYDDAHAAVAQMAREDLHGSDASTVMSVVTGSTSTQEFINSMQSRDALSRTEANAASDAANTLNTSMNRSERLAAIEKQIANLKTTADAKAASAQQAAASAQTQRDSLDQLRAEGETRRAELESQQSQLNSSVAKQAAQTVMLQSQVDSFNRQYAAEQAAAANQNNGGNQGQTQPGNNNTNNGGSNVTPAPALLLLLLPRRAPITIPVREPPMAITAMHTWLVSARGGRTNVVDRWASEHPRTWATVVSGILPLPRMVCEWTIIRRWARLSPSFLGRLEQMVSTVMWLLWKR